MEPEIDTWQTAADRALDGFSVKERLKQRKAHSDVERKQLHISDPQNPALPLWPDHDELLWLSPNITLELSGCNPNKTLPLTCGLGPGQK